MPKGKRKPKFKAGDRVTTKEGNVCIVSTSRPILYLPNFEFAGYSYDVFIEDNNKYWSYYENELLLLPEENLECDSVKILL